MKDFDWELLHELYKNPNLTKVANVLYITQPTLTKRLQHIEAEFDVTIVERTPKGLEFTPEGKYLAEQPLEDLSQLLEQRRLWYSTNAESKKLLDEWWEEQFQQVPPTGQVMGYVDVVWQMVQKGLGYTLCFLPEEYTNPYGLCLTPLVRKDGTPVTRNTWFLYPKNKRLNENVKRFVDFILRQRRTIASATGSGSFSPAVCQNTSEASTR